MPDCELLPICGFFIKHQESHDHICREFIETYCCGDKMNDCERKIYRIKRGRSPCDDMMPTGEFVSERHC